MISRPRACFGTAKKDVPRVLFRAQAMCDAMMANAAMFPSPTMTMAAFLALITALAAAQQYARASRATGSAAVRNTKRNAVWSAMESLQKYAQGLADVLDAESANSLIQAAGLLVAESPAHQKALLTARLTTTPGLVHLDANASLLVGKADARKKTFFHWQWSADGSATWNDMPPTAYANTDIPDLALMGTYSFRVSVTVGKVAGAWSQTVSLLVL